MKNMIIFMMFFVLTLGFITVDRECAHAYGKDSVFDMTVRRYGDIWAIKI